MVVLAMARIRRGRPGPHLAAPPERGEANAADPAVCVRCGAATAPLIATPEGWMCERCYADAK